MLYPRLLLPIAACTILLTILCAGVAYAQQDITPPVLLSVAFDPQQIDTGKAPATITVTVHITDDLSGLYDAALYFRKGGTTQSVLVEFRDPGGYGRRIEGDMVNGIYQASVTLPQYSAYGKWELFDVFLQDNVGNRSEVSKPANGGSSDTWPPLLDRFFFTVGPQEVTKLNVHVFIPSISTSITNGRR